jgi:hypothetical protein
MPDMRHEHVISRNPHVEPNPKPFFGELSAQNIDHDFVRNFHMPWIQWLRHRARSFAGTMGLTAGPIICEGPLPCKGSQPDIAELTLATHHPKHMLCGDILYHRAAVSIGVLLLASAIGIFAAEKTTMLFDRGLPTANLNWAAGGNMSNVAWADSEMSIDPKTGYPMEYWVPGDDFKIAQPGKYRIKTIRVWIVGDVPDGKGHKGGHSNKTHLTLWGGTVS